MRIADEEGNTLDTCIHGYTRDGVIPGSIGSGDTRDGSSMRSIDLGIPRYLDPWDRGDTSDPWIWGM